MTPDVEKTVEVLTEVAEFLEGQSDVVDGSYGEQVPNRAMGLLLEVQQEIERLTRLAATGREPSQLNR